MKDENILIIGATGNVGMELVKQFAASGKRVKALVRNESKAAGIKHLAEPVVGDLMDPTTLKSAFKNIERAFILAPPVGEAEKTMERNAFDAAVEAGVKRVVYLSSYAAPFGDNYPYIVHAAHEQLLTSLSVDWTVLRPTRFMPYTPFVWSSIFQRGLLLEKSGDGAMTMVDPADIAAVGVLALTTDGYEGQKYELTSEDSFSTHKLQDILSKALNKKLTIFEGDTEELRSALVESGAPGEYAPIMSHYFDSVADGRWQVTDTISKVLGRKPRSYMQWLDLNLPNIIKTFKEGM